MIYSEAGEPAFQNYNHKHDLNKPWIPRPIWENLWIPRPILRVANIIEDKFW